MTEQNEPSMEDILASIRNILAEDEENNPERAKDTPVMQDIAEMPVNTEAQKKTEPARFDSEPEQMPRAAETFPEKPSDPVVTETHEDVVKLTADMIVPQPQLGAQEAPASADDDDDDFTPEPVIPQEPMKEETLTDLIKETAERRLEDDDSLLAEPTVVAAAETLAHLRDIASEKRLSLGKGDMTIEAIVRETLRPYLKEWLDVNLPDIVERVVKKEIAHVMDRLDLK